jgi:hypothetical protein
MVRPNSAINAPPTSGARSGDHTHRVERYLAELPVSPADGEQKEAAALLARRAVVSKQAAELADPQSQ